MYIAYCDIKLKNILVDIIEKNIIDEIMQHSNLKVINFKNSKIEVRRNPKIEKNNITYGSCYYMALLKQISNNDNVSF